MMPRTHNNNNNVNKVQTRTFFLKSATLPKDSLMSCSSSAEISPVSPTGAMQSQ